MKINFLDDFEDEYFNTSKSVKHYQKSKKEIIELTTEEYKEYSKILATQAVDNKIIFGYVCQLGSNNAYVKWNKDSGLFVVYIYKDSDPYIIHFSLCDKRDYESGKWNDPYIYIDEIPSNK